MAESTTFLGLLTEIHDQITEYLDWPHRMRLRKVCRYFHELILPLNIHHMVEVEGSAFGIQKDLYTCRDCMDLRPRAKFADNMVKRKKARAAADAMSRFCVGCGINPREGTTRYTRGSIITVQGEHFVICIACGVFGNAAVERGRVICECQKSRSYVRDFRMRQEKARLRAEKALERARRREIYGSEREYSEDDNPPSPTRSDIEMGMIQSEADAYMNSPKAGSE